MWTLLSYWLVYLALTSFFLMLTWMEASECQRNRNDFLKLYLILLFIGLILQILTWPFEPFLCKICIPLELSLGISLLAHLQGKLLLN